MSIIIMIAILSQPRELERKALIRELHQLGQLSAYPAIYTDPELLREVKRERRHVIAKLRELPLAGWVNVTLGKDRKPVSIFQFNSP